MSLRDLATDIEAQAKAGVLVADHQIGRCQMIAEVYCLSGFLPEDGVAPDNGMAPSFVQASSCLGERTQMKGIRRPVRPPRITGAEP